MELNESIRMLINEGFEGLAKSEVSFGIKILAIFGAVYLFNILTRTGISVIHFGAYIFGLIKWIIFKVKKKDI